MLRLPDKCTRGCSPNLIALDTASMAGVEDTQVLWREEWGQERKKDQEKNSLERQARKTTKYASPVKKGWGTNQKRPGNSHHSRTRPCRETHEIVAA